MRRFRSTLFAVALLASTPLAAQPLSSDQPSKTESGAAFTAPQTWTMGGNEKVRTISAPEGDATVAIVDNVSASGAGDAAAKAWAAWRPDRARPPKLISPRAPREGWDERAFVSYETSPNEKLVLEAFTLRKGDKWTVLLLDAREATLEKRGAAVDLVYSSLRAPGYTPENFVDKPAHKLDAARIAQLVDFVKYGMDKMRLPGAGLALIQDGRVVYEEGLGVKKLGSPELVDEHTRFMVASNTKGMSTLMLATLVDEGKFGWDSKVTDVYPDFRLGNNATTAQVKMRHLVCACTGLPRKDLGWIFNTPRDTKAENVFKMLADTQPTSGFGEVYQYNNLITTAGGMIGGHVAYPEMEIGAAYDKAMQERVFAPLGMKDTTFSFAEALAGNHAFPHDNDIDGKAATGSHDFNYSIAPYRPAGGAWSSTHDMARYAMLELAKGVTPDGKRVVSEANLLERRKRGITEGENAWYGMGLSETTNIGGVPIIYHGGSMAGFKTNFWVIPDANVAAVLLTNSDSGNSLLGHFSRRLVEVIYDGKAEAVAGVDASAAARLASFAKEREKLTVPADTAEAAKLADAYHSPELGRLAVHRTPKGLHFQFTDWGSMMASRKNEDGTLSFVSIDPTVSGFPFVVGERNGKRILIAREGQHEYVFEEIAS